MRKGSISKFLKRIISTAIVLSIATIPALSVAPTLNVYADSEYIGGVGGAAGGGNKTYTDGVSQNKSALLLYTLNANGSVTDDMPIVVLNETQKSAWDKGAYVTEPIKTKFDNGGEENIETFTINIPNIILHKNGAWVSNWHEIREYWDGKASDLIDNGVKDEFFEAMRARGLWSEAIEMYDNGEPFYLAIETIAWSGKYVNGESEGKLASTAAGWAKFYGDKGMKYADASMRSFYSAALPYSLTLDRTLFGWSSPNSLSGYVTNEEIRAKGYGINFILMNGTPTHTIKTPTPSPAEVKSPTATNLSVIKVYESINPETQELITDGTFITTDCYSNLSINPEDTWEIISAETVSPLITSVGSIEPYDTITQGKTKKQEFDVQNLPVNVTLSPQEPTLIVRYRATNQELPPIRVTGTHTVPEQRITQSYRDTITQAMSVIKGKIPCDPDSHEYTDGCGDALHSCPGHDCDFEGNSSSKVTQGKYQITVYDTNVKRENLNTFLNT